MVSPSRSAFEGRKKSRLEFALCVHVPEYPISKYPCKYSRLCPKAQIFRRTQPKDVVFNAKPVQYLNLFIYLSFLGKASLFI